MWKENDGIQLQGKVISATGANASLRKRSLVESYQSTAGTSESYAQISNTIEKSRIALSIKRKILPKRSDPYFGVSGTYGEQSKSPK